MGGSGSKIEKLEEELRKKSDENFHLKEEIGGLRDKLERCQKDFPIKDDIQMNREKAISKEDYREIVKYWNTKMNLCKVKTIKKDEENDTINKLSLWGINGETYIGQIDGVFCLIMKLNNKVYIYPSKIFRIPDDLLKDNISFIKSSRSDADNISLIYYIFYVLDMICRNPNKTILQIIKYIEDKIASGETTKQNLGIQYYNFIIAHQRMRQGRGYGVNES